MLSLRTLFVGIEEWSIVCKLEERIIEAIDKPIMKFLKIIEFRLFWHLLGDDIEDYQREKFSEIVANLNNLENEVALKKLKIVFEMLNRRPYSDELKKCFINEMPEI